MKRKSSSLIVAVVFAAWACAVQAAETIPVQGFLTDAQGAPLTESVEITFSLYEQDGGGTPLWQETLPVQVDNGLFSVYLGNTVALDLSLFKDHQELWLGIQVADDQEMNRVYLGNVPYAAYARHTDADPAASIPQGFCMFSFSQTDCPPGWTKNTAHVDRALWVAADNPGQTGGSTSHSHGSGTLSASDHTHTTANHTLTIQEIPPHTHEYSGTDSYFWNGNTVDSSGALVQEPYLQTGSTGGGSPHNHGDTNPAGSGSLSGNTAEADSLPPYVQVVVCCKS